MKLTPNFDLAEFLVTGQHVAPLSPTADEIRNLHLLCAAVLQPIRDRTDAMKVTSGYRSLELNKLIGGSLTSQHMSGEAADVQPVDLGKTWKEIVAMTRAGLPVDQAIVYVRARGSGWIHLSYTHTRPARRELLVEPGTTPKRYIPWGSWAGSLYA